MKIGIISDTHGILRQEALYALEGCELIFHAGDIGKEEILKALEIIAPVVAVKGNNDKERWGQGLPEEMWTLVESKMIYMIHNLKESKAIFEGTEVDIIISGHSHIYKEEVRENRLYLNPGGAGPRRFGRATTAMVLNIENDRLQVDQVMC